METTYYCTTDRTYFPGTHHTSEKVIAICPCHGKPMNLIKRPLTTVRNELRLAKQEIGTGQITYRPLTGFAPFQVEPTEMDIKPMPRPSGKGIYPNWKTATIKYKVLMLAFATEVGQPIVIREVEIPADEAVSQDQILANIWYYGQNDNQPQQFPSVSIGDVATINGRFFLCCSNGWNEMTTSELEKYCKVPRRDRALAGLLKQI